MRAELSLDPTNVAAKGNKIDSIPQVKPYFSWVRGMTRTSTESTEGAPLIFTTPPIKRNPTQKNKRPPFLNISIELAFHSFHSKCFGSVKS